MKKFIFFVLLFAVFVTFINFIHPVEEAHNVPYPKGYRVWTHVKSEIVGPESSAFLRFGGIHHIYANKKAMQGYENGKFPDGSILVFDLLEMIEDGKGNVVEGKRKFIDIMAKDSKKFSATGGWGFEEFNGNSMIERNIGESGKVQCFNCHAKQEKNDFVFSKFRK